ncbi:MAG TPA: hypothetical protein DEQ40_09145 [Oxalobacteraceae bacterium]|jgi:hypothetical protein|nr:hypothetical protein [Oxalobacteraceae bacterium]
MSRPFVYVATPYSKYDGGLDAAFVEACKATAELIRRGIAAYSPIAHTHPVAIHGCIDPLDHDRWMALDAAMMDAASELYVIKMPGWDQSKGVAIEIETFRAAGKPIRFLSWQTLAAEAA